MYYRVSDKYGKLFRKVSWLDIEAANSDAKRNGGIVVPTNKHSVTHYV